MREADDEQPHSDYATVSNLNVEILEVKHGTNKKTNLKFTVFSFRVLEVVDQKIPRPEGLRYQSTEPMFPDFEIEVGAVQSYYADFKWTSTRNAIFDALNVIAGAFIGKVIEHRGQGKEDPDVVKALESSFNKKNKDNAAFFEGVRVNLDVSAMFKDGNPTGRTTFKFSPLAG